MIRKARREDRAGVIATLTAAFAHDPIIRFQFQDDDTYPARARAFFGHYFDVRLEGGEIFVAEDAGTALWSPPGGNRLGHAFVEQDWNTNVAPVLELDELERYEAFKAVLDAMTPPNPHWYLGLLAARPEKRGAGVARGLLEPMLQRADAERFPVFLETGQPVNLAIYERFDFEVIAEDRVPNGPAVWGMIRRPRAA